ncbi:MAG: MobF family relaxase [Phycisphaerales bacterium]
MLSIRHMTAGKENYYLQLAHEDYYLEGGEPPGTWFGHGARTLGLFEGTVSGEVLRGLFDGFGPNGKPLVQNAGRSNRQPGWDLTFSAPKSVSTLWSQSDETMRARIQAAHEKAVRTALGYLESEAAWTRRGKGGRDAERVGLVIGLFEHGTSRAQQPQLHTHSLILNIGLRADGSWGGIRSVDFYKHKMAGGAVYRAALANELRFELGLDPCPVKSWFELEGVSRPLMSFFSARRREIEEAIGTGRLASAATYAAAALSSRSHKVHAPRAELLPAWQRTGEEHGFGPGEAATLFGRHRGRPRGPEDILVIEPIRTALRDLLAHRSFIRERELVRAAAEVMQHGDASVDTVRTAVRNELDGLIEIGNENGYSIFATREMVDAERDIVRIADRMLGFDALTLTPLALADVGGLDGHSREQAAAIDHITATPGGVKVVDGIAGSGKSRMLRAAKDRWESAGCTVIGAAVAGKAARELEAASGIKSDTIAMTLGRLGFGRSLLKRKAPLEPLKLNSKTVLVIDEASMVGTLQLRELLRSAEAARSKVVLVGDTRQLPAIDAGHPFSKLVSQLGAAKLRSVRRQQHEAHRLATAALSEGDVQTALSIYSGLDRLRLYENDVEALGHLVGMWQEQRTEDLSESLMLAGSNRQVDRLNELAQRVRRSRRELSGAGARIGDEQYYVGDRIRFTENSRSLGVWNGDAGVVTRIRRKGLLHHEITVRTDAGGGYDWLGRPKTRDVTLHTASYRSIRLGYASTTHAAQGTTVDKAFVLAGEWMATAELSYVQLTRHREDLFIAAPRGPLGEDIEAVVEAMSGTHDRRHAIDFEGTGPGVPTALWDTTTHAIEPDEEHEVSP